MRLSRQTKDVLWGLAKFTLALSVFVAGGLFVWASTFHIPDIEAFANRQVEQSTKIYDRTGEVVLYNLNQNVRRSTVPLNQISENMQKATIAIEDSDFYSHLGIDPSAIVRAIYTNLKRGELEQGGSTITQQVVKNTLLTPEKTISRKIKEWILALRLDQELEKDTILEIYLNEVPYGGRVYGAEEAAKRYFGKSAKDLTLAESAYLAALPKAPTYYSPYGNHREDLKARKNEVLREMQANGFINEAEFEEARSAEVTFVDQDEQSLKAPHFVFHIKEQLEQEYGTTAIERRGLRVITSLDYELQQSAEDIISEYGAQNAERFNANNAALVAVDPKTGQVLAMVGSRDYSNKEIQGSFNAATARRQPGSSFKPFVYATALNEGYTHQTTVFDLPTQFSAVCSPGNLTSSDNCFSPINYDDAFRGPITFRNALAQSVNIPAVKVLYLAGMRDSIDTAQAMGINTLDKQPDRYGLTLVLGSGEVTLLDLTSAYSVFANEGVKNPHANILRVEDATGEVLEEFQQQPERVLPQDTARMINDILSDNAARAPAFGSNSPLHFENYDVAVKTGTTDDYRDLWTVGYSPNIAVGVWSGNNTNEERVAGEVAGFVVAPMWHDFMAEALSQAENNDSFTSPDLEIDSTTKPVLQGIWRGGYFANNSAPSGDEDDGAGSSERVVGGIHNILHWVDKDNPRGPIPGFPASDPQYEQWEYSVRRWATGGGFGESASGTIETTVGSQTEDESGDVVAGAFLRITSPVNSSYNESDRVRISVENNNQLDRIELLLNGEEVDDDDSQPFRVSVDLDDVDDLRDVNNLTVVGISEDGERNTYETGFVLER